MILLCRGHPAMQGDDRHVVNLKLDSETCAMMWTQMTVNCKVAVWLTLHKHTRGKVQVAAATK